MPYRTLEYKYAQEKADRLSCPNCGQPAQSRSIEDFRG